MHCTRKQRTNALVKVPCDFGEVRPLTRVVEMSELGVVSLTKDSFRVGHELTYLLTYFSMCSLSPKTQDTVTRTTVTRNQGRSGTISSEDTERGPGAPDYGTVTVFVVARIEDSFCFESMNENGGTSICKRKTSEFWSSSELSSREDPGK